MGSSESKPTKGGSDKASRARARSQSPKEKHNSADSKAPLTDHAAQFATPRDSYPARQTGAEESIAIQHTRTNSNEDRIERAPYAPSIASPPKTHLYGNNLGTGIDDIEGHLNVTRPPPPPRLHQLDELIDPDELPIDCHIRSPSGTMLALEQFLVHPERPRSIRERQEMINERVRAASRLGVEVEKGDDEGNEKSGVAESKQDTSKKKKQPRQRCCWCFRSS